MSGTDLIDALAGPPPDGYVDVTAETIERMATGRHRRTRAIVGSIPHRREIPSGREAVERAVRHCRFWGEDTPGYASMRAFVARNERPDSGTVFVEWLPDEYRYESLETLKSRLAEERW